MFESEKLSVLVANPNNTRVDIDESMSHKKGTEPNKEVAMDQIVNNVKFLYSSLQCTYTKLFDLFHLSTRASVRVWDHYLLVDWQMRRHAKKRNR